MQFLFIVETTKKNESDALYIKSFINNFFDVNNTALHFIFAEGKGNLTKKQKEIDSKIRSYRGRTLIFICMDLDKETPENIQKNNRIIEYAAKNDYDVIWFSKTIEDVFLGDIVLNEDKKRRAAEYSKLKNVNDLQFKNFDLFNLSYIRHKSNIGYVIKKYLKLKNNKNT